ncbi:MAG: hypothetical protein WA857_14750 [Candidatus Acidiferrum sp.]
MAKAIATQARRVWDVKKCFVFSIMVLLSLVARAFQGTAYFTIYASNLVKTEKKPEFVLEPLLDPKD